MIAKHGQQHTIQDIFETKRSIQGGEAKGDQKVKRVNIRETDLYAPALKHQWDYFMAIAADNGHKIFKTDTSRYSCMATWQLVG